MEKGNENISKNGWSEYGRLVLNELQRLNDGQEKLREDFDKQFTDLNATMSEFKSTEKDVNDIKEWKKDVIDIWSPSQMKQGKDEIYKHKGYFNKAIGAMLIIQVLFSLLVVFKDEIFK